MRTTINPTSSATATFAPGWRLWRQPGAKVAVALLVGFIVVRTAFLSTLEAPEPRYVLVCFPALFALAAQVFAGKGAVRTAVARVEMSAEPYSTP